MANDFHLYLGCKSADDGNKAFPISYDFPITEEFGETLDSASALIRVDEGSRLVDLEPYQEALIKGQGLARPFLVDNFVEKEIRNAKGDKVYEYSISLMSETKYLEKIQLPNTCYTHPKDGSARKSVYDAVSELVEAYSPRIRALNPDGTYTLRPLLSLSPIADWTRMKETPMADCSMSKPTLRQALTTAMSQCGCIPKVAKREVSFLDFRAPRTPFSDLTGRGFIAERSMASDGYVNSLVVSADNVIDEDGKSVSEQLCFRDRDHVLLKQKENLKLETRFPIYKVKKFVLNAWGTTDFLVEGRKRLVPSKNEGYGFELRVSREGKFAVMEFAVRGVYGTQYSIKGHFDLIASEFGYDEVNGGSIERKQRNEISFDVDIPNKEQGYSDKMNALANTEENSTIVVTGVFTGTVSDNLNSRSYSSEKIIMLKFNPDEHALDTASFRFKNVPCLAFSDITPLCVESMKRKNLEVDFTKMPTRDDLSKFPESERAKELGKYVYGTVHYAVGGRLISGFSETYTRSFGLFDYTKTYIENIMDSINLNFSMNSVFGNYVYPGSATAIRNEFKYANNNFSHLFFDVEYVPMARIKDVKTKREVDLEIEQLDQSANGTSSYQSLSATVQEKADRFGNDALAITQRVSSLSEAMPLNSEYEGRVVYRREFAFGRNAIDVTYRLMKDKVLQNYFTSIVTKYRAYQNVSYTQSIEREEIIPHYLCFAKGDVEGVSYEGALAFTKTSRGIVSFVDALAERRERAEIANSGEMAFNQNGLYAVTKNETFSLASRNSFSFGYSAFDNYSDGLTLDFGYLKPDGSVAIDQIGGVPQKGVALEGKNGALAFYSQPYSFDKANNDLIPHGSTAEKLAKRTNSLPVINVSGTEDFASRFAEGFFDYPPSFEHRKKDNAERVIAWSRFEAWSPDIKGLRFGKWMWRFSTSLGGTALHQSLVAFQNGETAQDEPLSVPTGGVDVSSLFSFGAPTQEGKRVALKVKAGVLDANKPLLVSRVKDGKRYDLFSCDKASDILGGVTICLSDKKGTGVYSFTGDGVMSKSHVADLTLRGHAKKR